MRFVVLPALLLATHALPCLGQRPGNSILDLARTWSGAGPALKCQRINASASDIPDQVDPQHCEWEGAKSGALMERVRAGVDLGGGPSLVFWERFARDDVDAERVIDSLGLALELRGLRRHQCGRSTAPGGLRIQEILWEGSDLLLFLMHAAPPDSVPRLLVVASDDAATMPAPTLCHLKSAPDALVPRERGSAPRALRFDMVLGTVDIRHTVDSGLAIMHYRTNAPARDSASVRRTLTERLARRNSMLAAQASGVMPSRTTRLIIRPCHTDSCPPLGNGPPTIAGDLDFTLRPDSSWAPTERPSRPPRSSR